MRTRTSLIVAAAAAALALGAAVAPATAAVQPHATAVLTAGGTALAKGAVVNGTIASGTKATFYSSATGTSGVACTQSAFTASVLTNPAPSGTATESLSAQTFGGCTSNVVGVTGVQSITINGLPFNASVSDAAGLPVTVTKSGGSITTTVVLNTLLGTTSCVYTGPSLVGAANNAANSITFTNQHFTKSSGSSLCFSDAYFSVKYAPITSGGVAVTVN